LKYYQKIIFYSLVCFIVVVLIYLYQSTKTVLLHNNYELRNIEIQIKSNDNYLTLLNDKLNQYDDLIWYSYIDNSDGIRFYNSLKNKTINQLMLYEYFLRESTIESLLSKFSKIKDSRYDFVEYKNMFALLIDELYLYINNAFIDEDIGNKIFASLLGNNNFHEKNHKIIIKSNKNFKNQFELVYDYKKLYQFINNLNNENSQIISIKFYDRCLYDNYMDENRDDIKVLFDDYILCYSDSINDLTKSLSKLNDLNIDFTSSSILDLIVADDIIGDRYKIINKILINAGNFKSNSENNLDYNIFIQRLQDIENTIIDLEKFNGSFGDAVYKIRVIIDFFENNKSSYKYFYNLTDSYNRNIYNNIKYIANTEKFSEDKLSLFMFNDYFRDGKYVSRFNIDNENLHILKSAFNFNTSKK